MADAAFSPHSDRAELAIIAHIMLWEDELLPEISKTVQPADFYHPIYRALYEGALSLHQKWEPINQLTLYHELVATKKWHPSMDTEMGYGVTCICNPETAIYCARWVKELSERRKAIKEHLDGLSDAAIGKQKKQSRAIYEE